MFYSATQNLAPTDRLIPADVWLRQIGGRWIACPFSEINGWWIGADPADVPVLWALPISTPPTSGTLIWADIHGNEQETQL